MEIVRNEEVMKTRKVHVGVSRVATSIDMNYSTLVAHALDIEFALPPLRVSEIRKRPSESIPRNDA